MFACPMSRGNCCSGGPDGRDPGEEESVEIAWRETCRSATDGLTVASVARCLLQEIRYVRGATDHQPDVYWGRDGC